MSVSVAAENKILLIIYEAAAAHCLWRDNAGGRVSAVCIVRSLVNIFTISSQIPSLTHLFGLCCV